MTTIRKLRLPSGRMIPQLGQGTWNMGTDSSKRKEEIAALRAGVDLGMTLIDTAEYYGPAEPLIAEALSHRRKEIFLVSKVVPSHAKYHDTIEACENSLRKLETDYLDLYLLHWPGSTPFQVTLEGFQALKRAGKILDYGVSNFDLNDIKEAQYLLGGSEIATDQVLFNLTRRGIEWDLLPWSLTHQMPLMAYSPLEEGRLLNAQSLREVAERHSATFAQIALAWVLQKGLIAIPKASNVKHVTENRAAYDINLTREDLAELDAAFPPPKRKIPLEVI